MERGLTDEPIGKAKGGVARAAALSSEERQQIARKAADARWGTDIPQATHDGPLRIGNIELDAAVLPNGLRLLSQGTFLQALGRSRRPKAGTGGLSTVDSLPFFLQAEQLKPFVSNELMLSTTPILFRMKSGHRTIGYDAKLLPMVCEVYLRFRDDALAETGRVPKQYAHIVRHCDALMRGLATVGIIALVDEATGYQDLRDRQALQAILDQYLRKEFAAWAKQFPDEFYREIFRLRNWTWRGMKVNRPQVVAKYTNDLVYARLAPGILEELRKKNPKNEKGYRKARHHQWLTESIGHPALAQHIFAVIAFMRSADGWADFKRRLDVALPKQGNNMQFAFMAE
jgi:P63C domain